MDVITIKRKGQPLFVRQMLVGELDKSKCSHKFLSHNLPDNEIVNVKCFSDGTLDLRGKKQEYRIIISDPIIEINNNMFSSNDHIFLTKRGHMRADKLQKGDIIFGVSGETKITNIISCSKRPDASIIGETKINNIKPEENEKN